MEEERLLLKLKDELKRENETDAFLVSVLETVHATAHTRVAVAKSKVGAAVKRIVDERPADSRAHALAKRIMAEWKVKFAASDAAGPVSPHSKAPSSSPPAALTTPSVKAPDDAKRKKTCALLQEIFAGDAGDYPLDVRARRAIEIETAMFTLPPTEYAAKYRSFKHNLVRNPVMRTNILDGVTSAAILITLTADELASEDQKEALNKDVTELANAKRSDWVDDNIERIKKMAGVPEDTKGMFKCSRCGSNKTSHYQKQTRSAGALSIYILCLCTNHARSLAPRGGEKTNQ